MRLGQAYAEAFGNAAAEPAAEERIDKARRSASELALCKWVQAQDPHSSGERVGKRRDQQHIGGAGQDEPPRDPTPVYRSLERCEQRRRTLHLVENYVGR
jgi:hypothetical protein